MDRFAGLSADDVQQWIMTSLKNDPEGLIAEIQQSAALSMWIKRMTDLHAPPLAYLISQYPKRLDLIEALWKLAEYRDPRNSALLVAAKVSPKAMELLWPRAHKDNTEKLFWMAVEKNDFKLLARTIPFQRPQMLAGGLAHYLNYRAASGGHISNKRAQLAVELFWQYGNRLDEVVELSQKMRHHNTPETVKDMYGKWLAQQQAHQLHQAIEAQGVVAPTSGRRKI